MKFGLLCHTRYIPPCSEIACLNHLPSIPYALLLRKVTSFVFHSNFICFVYLINYTIKKQTDPRLVVAMTSYAVRCQAPTPWKQKGFFSHLNPPITNKLNHAVSLFCILCPSSLDGTQQLTEKLFSWFIYQVAQRNWVGRSGLELCGSV
jgi:hypothetical protein